LLVTLFVWLANLLTVLRIPLGGAYLATVGDLRWSIALIVLAGASDAIDGRIARSVRRRHIGPGGPGRIGEWLDPVCDKFFVLTVLIGTWIDVRPPIALLALIGARELILVPLGLVYLAVILLYPQIRYRFAAGAIGKATTVAQYVALLAVLLESRAAPALAVVAGALGVAAVVYYVARAARLAAFSAQPDRARHEIGSAPAGVPAGGEVAILRHPWAPQTSDGSSSTKSRSSPPSRS